MSHHPAIVAIGASAGGVEAISELVRALPDDLNAVVLIVLHRPVERFSRLREILSGQTRMPVVIPRDGEILRTGICYLGNPNHHITVGNGLRVHYLPDHFYRSHNVDALFFSVALQAKDRAIGVVLSGALKDGTLGLRAITSVGGTAMVQSPDEAAVPDMPRNAIASGGPIHLVAPVGALAEEICRLAKSRAPGRVDDPAEAANGA